MPGIGNTVETDLVGELVEVIRRDSDHRYTDRVARGRVRAVTTDAHGWLRLWIELVDQECVNFSSYYFTNMVIGNLVCTNVGAEQTIHLIKEQR